MVRCFIPVCLTKRDWSQCNKLDSSLKESAISFTKIKFLVVEFKQNCTCCPDEYHCGLLNEMITRGNVQQSLYLAFQ